MARIVLILSLSARHVLSFTVTTCTCIFQFCWESGLRARVRLIANALLYSHTYKNFNIQMQPRVYDVALARVHTYYK